MKKTEVITLNETDIIKVMAEKFNASENDISISVNNGDPQYPTQTVYIVIKRKL